MPWTFLFTLVGGLSISAFPLFSGFVSKSMIVQAGFEDHKLWMAFLLMLASAGTFLHTGLKVPYFIWFGKNHCSKETWERAAEPTWNMLAAMALTAFLCIFIGCYTPYLYLMLPYPVEYHPYTSYHISETLQILLFTALGFFLLLKKLTPEAKISFDLDWFYRKGGQAFLWVARRPVQWIDQGVGELYRVAGSASSHADGPLVGGIRPSDHRRCRRRTRHHDPFRRQPPARRPARRSPGESHGRLRRGRGPGPDLCLVLLTPSTDDDPLLHSPRPADPQRADLQPAGGRRRGPAHWQRAPAPWWALLCTTVVAALSLPLWCRFNPETADFQFREQVAWIPFLKIDYTLGVDGISLLLVLLTTLILPLCVLASWTYIKTRIKEFFICLLVMESAMIGVFCARDAILFFVFWEAMLIPMAVLIGVWGGPRRLYASLKFFIYTMAGSVFLLVALIALRLKTGSFDLGSMVGQQFSPVFQFWVFAAFFLSFAIKVPMFPFHTWLPAAHVEAPTAGSVILASVLLKMGTYGFLRFCLPITPHATLTLAPWMLAAVGDRHPLRRTDGPGAE
jgi:NADH:ubiquinone oxidoreductase subunit 4 (subunit M)